MTVLLSSGKVSVSSTREAAEMLLYRWPTASQREQTLTEAFQHSRCATPTLDRHESSVQRARINAAVNEGHGASSREPVIRSPAQKFYQIFRPPDGTHSSRASCDSLGRTSRT
ncbi:DUF982 domain-containing protein [Mesorhizobium sp. M1423]|uniref:DUF982 domain-containing protein n=1 Tax=Mesorhizobium sp. M1423 TaxID=2957101 RepID=UPI0033364CD0